VRNIEGRKAFGTRQNRNKKQGRVQDTIQLGGRIRAVRTLAKVEKIAIENELG
jgi:hypothetical protein